MLTRLTLLAYFLFSRHRFLCKRSDITSELPALTVMGQETANQRPVTTYETPISNLDFDPRVDFQSRNMAEAQGDISIRGGTFENTGVKLGSANMLDCQTGHYMTELPIAPEMLGEPKVLTVLTTPYADSIAVLAQYLTLGLKLPKEEAHFRRW